MPRRYAAAVLLDDVAAYATRDAAPATRALPYCCYYDAAYATLMIFADIHAAAFFRH